MKKFTLLLMASALLIPGLAAAKDLRSIKSDEGRHVSQKIGNQMIVKNSDKQNSMLDFKAKSPKKNTVAKASEYGDIIYEAPAGEVKTLARSGYATYAYYGMLMTTSYENKISEFVMCDNGDVYMKNPITQYITNTYLKGKLDGNQIVFDLPQPITVMDYYGEDLYLLVTILQYCDDWYYPCNTEEAAEMGLPEITDQFVITINEDGTYSLETEDSMLVPGLIYHDDLAWTGYSEWSSEWKDFSATTNPGPGEGAELDNVAVLYDGVGHYAKLAMDGDDIFVQGIFAEQPESWIQGKRDGNKVSFPSGQYLGEDLDQNYYTYFAAATIEEEWDDYYEEWYNVYVYDEEIVFDFDEETMTMTSEENKAIAYNTSDTQILYLNVLHSPVIKKQPTEISQTPQNPYDLTFINEYYESYGYNWLEFNLPMYNVNDELLNPTDLYYIIYIDGDEMVFDPIDYINIDYEMTLIPYDFNDLYDFVADGNYHEVYFYFDGAEEVGVQLCSVKDGEIVGESDIVSVNTSSGVKTVTDTVSKRIESTKYFNMHGQEVSNPSEGIFVKTVKYNDGSVRSFKVIKK